MHILRLYRSTTRSDVISSVVSNPSASHSIVSFYLTTERGNVSKMAVVLEIRYRLLPMLLLHLLSWKGAPNHSDLHPISPGYQS